MYICTVTINKNIKIMASNRTIAKRTYKSVRVGDFSVTAIMIGDKIATFYGNIPCLHSDKPIDREMLRKHVEQYI